MTWYQVFMGDHSTWPKEHDNRFGYCKPWLPVLSDWSFKFCCYCTHNCTTVHTL